MVRPNFQLSRTTIILRDLPPLSPQEVEALFEKEGEEKGEGEEKKGGEKEKKREEEGGEEKEKKKGGKRGEPVSVTCEMGGYWYVEFGSEEEALEALLYIRGKQVRRGGVGGGGRREGERRESFLNTNQFFLLSLSSPLSLSPHSSKAKTLAPE